MQSSCHVLALLHVTTDDTQAASRIESMFENCPHAALVMAPCDDVESVKVLFSVPRHKVWWVEDLEREPHLIGGLSAQVSWLVQRAPRYSLLRSSPHDREEDEPPCGSNCLGCRHYQRRCSGCSVSRYYVQSAD